MKRILACTFISTLMAGCGGGGSGSDLEKANENTTPDPGSSDGNDDNSPVTPPEQVTVLEGTWKKPCGPVEGEAHYDIVTISFTRSAFATSIENYLDSACTTPLPGAPNPTSSGNFTLGEDVLLGSGLTATELTSHVTQFNGANFQIDEYNVVYINNNVFYTGEGTASSPAQRPTSLDFDRPFYRVN